ncbi:unnamed protein product [Pedinophyceae sp. YPF-701]|nr:unnamed protein product [Pedinophyceae sp. YPF-701]
MRRSDSPERPVAVVKVEDEGPCAQPPAPPAHGQHLPKPLIERMCAEAGEPLPDPHHDDIAGCEPSKRSRPDELGFREAEQKRPRGDVGAAPRPPPPPHAPQRVLRLGDQPVSHVRPLGRGFIDICQADLQAVARGDKDFDTVQQTIEAWYRTRGFVTVEHLVAGIRARTDGMLPSRFAPAALETPLLTALQSNVTLRHLGQVPARTATWLRERCERLNEGGWEYATRLAFAVCGAEPQALHMLLRAARAAGAPRGEVETWAALLMGAALSRTWRVPGGAAMADACAQGPLYLDVDEHRSTVTGVAKKPTREQGAVAGFQWDREGPRVLLVPSGAGTGKTFTIERRCLAVAERGRDFLYLAFNRRVCAEARRRLRGPALSEEAANERVRTLHSIAFVAMVVGERPDAKRERGPDGKAMVRDGLSLADVAKVLRKCGLDPEERKWGVTVCGMVRDTLKRFTASADQSVAPRHLSRETLASVKDLPKHITEEYVLRCARKVWKSVADANDTDTAIWHDGYMKLFQLALCSDDARASLHRVPRATELIVDEGQDLSGCQRDSAMRLLWCGYFQRAVVVGDPAQAIYSWRGAVDTLGHIKRASPGNLAERRLSQVYRFGPSIAAVANSILAMNDYGVGTRLIGASATGDVWRSRLPPIRGDAAGYLGSFLEAQRSGTPETNESLTVLCYTWNGLLVVAMMAADARVPFARALREGRRGSLAKLTQQAELMRDVVRLLRAAEVGQSDVRHTALESSAEPIRDIRSRMKDGQAPMSAQEAIGFLEGHDANHQLPVSECRAALEAGHFPGCKGTPEASLDAVLRAIDESGRERDDGALLFLDTIHQSKGNEFSIVLVHDDGRLLDLDTVRDVLGLPRWCRVGADGQCNLAYVAATRPMKLLILPDVLVKVLDGLGPVNVCNAMAKRLVVRDRDDLLVTGAPPQCMLCDAPWSDHVSPVCQDPSSAWNRDPSARVACVRSPPSAMLHYKRPRSDADGSSQASCSIAGVVCGTCSLVAVLASRAPVPPHQTSDSPAVLCDGAAAALRQHWSQHLAGPNPAVDDAVRMLGLEDDAALECAIAAAARCLYPPGAAPVVSTAVQADVQEAAVAAGEHAAA